MDTRRLGRLAHPGRSADAELWDLGATATPADIAVSWAAVFAAIAGMILLSGLA
jgi:hypothetical protein